MKLAIVAGAHGTGKTALILHVARHAREAGLAPGVFKVDAVEAADDEVYRRHGFAAAGHAARDVCPDHEAMVVLADAWRWGTGQGLGLLVVETAGLCHRCSPFLGRALAVCVVSGLSGLRTPEKMRPIVEQADVVVLTRAEMLGHAERQVLLGGLAAINPRAALVHADGLTGEGTRLVSAAVLRTPDLRLLPVERLRSSLPMGYCHFCQGMGSGHE